MAYRKWAAGQVHLQHAAMLRRRQQLGQHRLWRDQVKLLAQKHTTMVLVVRRGMGQQGKLGLYNFLGFWGFGVIVGYLLCFHVGWGLKGLWSGIVAGVFLTRWEHF